MLGRLKSTHSFLALSLMFNQYEKHQIHSPFIDKIFFYLYPHVCFLGSQANPDIFNQ